MTCDSEKDEKGDGEIAALCGGYYGYSGYGCYELFERTFENKSGAWCRDEAVNTGLMLNLVKLFLRRDMESIAVVAVNLFTCARPLSGLYCALLEIPPNSSVFKKSCSIDVF